MVTSLLIDRLYDARISGFKPAIVAGYTISAAAPTLTLELRSTRKSILAETGEYGEDPCHWLYATGISLAEGKACDDYMPTCI